MEEEKKKNSKKIIKIVTVILLLIIIITTIVLYRENRFIQNLFDEKIFNKVTTADNWNQIEISNDSNTYICAYNRNIGILSNNVFKVYNTSGRSEVSLDIEITNPLFCSNGKYLSIAEKDGSKVYLISDNNIAWQADVEGKIERITTAKNGYIAVSITQTSYKSIVIVFNSQGKEVCKTYLANTYAVDIAISNNCKRLAIAETNLSGIQIKSRIRIIDLASVEQGKENSEVFNEELQGNPVIIFINFDDSNELISMLDDKIIKISNNEEKTIWEYDENTLFADINLKNKTIQAVSTQSETAQVEIRIKNNTNQNIRTYIINSLPKEIKTKGNTIVVNAGNEVYVLNSSGFLKTKYQSNQEIKEIVLSEQILGIVYKNKIELINF